MEDKKMTQDEKFATLRSSPITTLAFLGKVIDRFYENGEDDEFLKKNSELIHSEMFRSLVQAAINTGIHSIREVHENTAVDNKIIFNVICGEFMWLPAIQTDDIRGKEYNMTDVENVVTAMAHISASLPDYEVLFKFIKAD